MTKHLPIQQIKPLAVRSDVSHAYHLYVSSSTWTDSGRTRRRFSRRCVQKASVSTFTTSRFICIRSIATGSGPVPGSARMRRQRMSG